MEQDIKLGDVGDLDLKLSGGKVSVSVSVAVPGAALSAGVSVVIDGAALVDKLKAAIEAKFPATTVVDEAVFAVLKSALSAV